MTFHDIASLIPGKMLADGPDAEIRHLLFDSRRPVTEPSSSVFFAISGKNHDGHRYIHDMYQRGIRMFVVEKNEDFGDLDGSQIWLAEDAVHTLQQIVTLHRNKFDGEVIGITGSNGKTIVKEWLYQLISPHRYVVKSPSSYNSQLGVPLSVWQLDEDHETGIFEAGISSPGEMDHLERIIRPTTGIFTNIGSAHDEGFEDQGEKIREKMKLFRGCRKLIYCRDHEAIHREVHMPSFSWGHHPESDLWIKDSLISGSRTSYSCMTDDTAFSLELPFTDHASLENAMHVAACMLQLGFLPGQIQEGISRLRPLRMRLEMKQGPQGSYLIDDTYNNDLAGLRTALDFLSNVSGENKKSLILSDILQSGLDEKSLIREIGTMVSSAGISRFTGIGPLLSANRDVLGIDGEYYESTEAFLENLDARDYRDEIILIKGARPFRFELIVGRLEEKVHGTVLEVDLGALTHNLNHFRSRLAPGVQVMVMVKAFAYGAGSLEVANLLQYHRVNYLGVAYADEGIFLRRNGIKLPIMVMNPTPESFGNMRTFNLEPEIYSPGILRELMRSLNGSGAAIHIKLDTGMHRLGFERKDIVNLKQQLEAHPEIEVHSIFSHLAASEAAEHGEFTRQQVRLFDAMSSELMDGLPGKPLRHILNSSGIIRYPDYQFDMVRLGIGLYGIEGNDLEQEKLMPVSTLRTIISQVKEIEPGESVGYGRKGEVKRPMKIATIAIGYADGFSRILGNGRGHVFIQGKMVPVIGNVCMDMTMVDVTGLEVKEGDIVEIFGPNIPLPVLADMCGTIPYEILTNVSQRVKRVFFSD